MNLYEEKREIEIQIINKNSEYQTNQKIEEIFKKNKIKEDSYTSNICFLKEKQNELCGSLLNEKLKNEMLVDELKIKEKKIQNLKKQIKNKMNLLEEKSFLSGLKINQIKRNNNGNFILIILR